MAQALGLAVCFKLFGRNTMKLDLSFLLQQPDFSVRAILTIDALAPLSMVTSMPGAYYRSQSEPSEEMLYGLLENALGLHCSENYLTSQGERSKFIKRIHKVVQRAQGREMEVMKSKVGFVSLLQFHLRFACKTIPVSKRYEDYWSRHLRNNSFPQGSHNYDYHVIPIMNAKGDGDVTFGDKNKIEFSTDPALITDFQKGSKVHNDVIRPYFPMYFASPTAREYIIPQGAYKYRVETSSQLARLLVEAIDDPAAPLYLGANDGWVDVRWETLS